MGPRCGGVCIKAKERHFWRAIWYSVKPLEEAVSREEISVEQLAEVTSIT